MRTGSSFAARAPPARGASVRARAHARGAPVRIRDPRPAARLREEGRQHAGANRLHRRRNQRNPKQMERERERER